MLGVYPEIDGVKMSKLFAILESEGVHAKQVLTAIRYLNAAVVKVAGPRDHYNRIRPYEYNDSASHEQVLAMFDLAIRNAKRRHIDGGTYASGVKKAVGQ